MVTDPVATTRSDLDDLSGSSELVTWTCTSSPCPWGDSLSNPAVVWPVSLGPVANRLGYTASPAAYVPAGAANGLTVWIDGGSAGVYAGQPDASSHRLLVTLAAGDSYPVEGLAEGEVVSVQSDSGFAYRVTATEPPPESDPALPSQTVTWTCTSSPCPWGDTLSGEAVVWPDDAGASESRLGYTVSPAIYLPATRANGAHIEIDTGSASAFAGYPGDDSHRFLTTISAGQSYDVEGLAAGEVLSVQSDASFGYRAWLPPPSDPDPDPPPDAIEAVPSFWRCNVPECSGADWTGAVINWPEWAAYQNNARSGDQSRSVFAGDGTPLYPYMGAWAQGCQVTAVSGTVLIIEWQRGTDSWRETWLEPGQSHTIDLIPPEDGAMIETDDGMTAFSVTLANCTPAPLAP